MNMIEYKDPGRYIPFIFLLYSWGSLFGVPSKVPLDSPVEGKVGKMETTIPWSIGFRG